MNVLGIDTATRSTSLALCGIEKTYVGEGRDSELLQHVDALCREVGIAPRELDAVAVGAGPGSFTGLRIGMATAKGIAFAAGKPLWAVSSLAALAWRVRAEITVAILDARRGEIYAGIYDRSLQPLAPERVMPPDQLAGYVGERAASYIGDTAPLGKPWQAGTPSALGVVELALAGARADVLVSGGPTYIRASEAEIRYPDGVPGALRKPVVR